MNNELQIISIDGIDCYEKDGTAYLKLETVARGLGFTKIATSGNEVVRWERVKKYLEDLGVPTCGHDDFIPENIFYRLAMKAKNNVAEAFQAKVADEIIPSIRKHGGYIAGQETLSDEELLAKAVLVAQSKIVEKDKIIEKQKTTIIEQNKTIEQQNERLQIQKPFVQAAMKLQRANNTVSMGTTSKALKGDGIDIGRNELFAILREHKILMDNNSPYQRYMDLGLFEVKIETKENHYGKTKLIPVTRVTGKGLIFLNKKLREWLEIEGLDIEI